MPEDSFIEEIWIRKNEGEKLRYAGNWIRNFFKEEIYKQFEETKGTSYPKFKSFLGISKKRQSNLLLSPFFCVKVDESGTLIINALLSLENPILLKVKDKGWLIILPKATGRSK